MNHLENTLINKIQANADSLLQNIPFPLKKNEDWKYSRISDFHVNEYATAKNNTINDSVIKEHLIMELDSYKIIFIDGVFSPKLSFYPKEKLVILPLSEALKDERYFSIIKKKYNSITDKHHFFCVLNSSSFPSGVFIYLPKNIKEEKPIELLYINSEQSEKAKQNIRNLLILEQSSEVCITQKIHTLSTYSFLTNAVNEIFIEKNAVARIYKIQNDTKLSNLIDLTYIQQEQDSQAFIHTFSFGGNTTRNELTFDHNGENINSTLKGITIIGNSQEVGNHTMVHHNQPNCESHELYRGIYLDDAHGIFNGKIKVHKKAQKTNAFQQNNSILLSNKAEIDSKPQLEIFADDVKCSHGCTIGQLDNDALFYMKQRGIHQKEAQALLMLAFFNDVLNTVNIPELKTEINKLIAKKLNVNVDIDF